MNFIDLTGAFMLFNIVMFVAFMAFAVCAFAFWVWMLVDCLTHEASEGNDKIVWMLVIVLANWVGALIYYFVRRRERTRGLQRRGGLAV